MVELHLTGKSRSTEQLSFVLALFAAGGVTGDFKAPCVRDRQNPKKKLFRDYNFIITFLKVLSEQQPAVRTMSSIGTSLRFKFEHDAALVL